MASQHVQSVYPLYVDGVFLALGVSYYIPTASDEAIQAFLTAWYRDKECVVGDILRLLSHNNPCSHYPSLRERSFISY